MISTLPSSSGWRSASSAGRENSGSSSRNSTPRWASVISPGRGRAPAADQPRRRDRVVRRAERPLARQAAAAEPGDAVDLRDLERLVEASAAAGSPAAGARASSCRLPGGPTISRLCPPAAAISSARLASSWPRTSARSGGSARGAATRRAGRDRLGRPAAVQQLGEPRRGRRRAITSSPSTSAASAAFAAGTTSRAVARPRGRRARSRARRAPAAARRSSDSSPQTAQSLERARAGTWPLAASTPTAIARSKLGPALRSGAGARFDGQPLQRELEPGVEERRPHALARLAHGAVGQPDDRERGSPLADVDLDRDLAAVDPLEGECGDAGEHAGTLGGPRSRVGTSVPLTTRATVPRRATVANPVTQVAAHWWRRPPSVGRMAAEPRPPRASARSASDSRAPTSSARATTLLERNFRTRYGELDLVARRRPLPRLLRGQDARRGRAARARLGPLDAIGPRASGAGSRRMAARVARRAAARDGPRPRRDLRFDAIGVTSTAQAPARARPPRGRVLRRPIMPPDASPRTRC